MRYSYDAVGNMIAMLEYTNPGSASGQIQWFDYDHLNRLESAYSEAEGAGQYNHSGEANDYDYDKLGNITAFGNSNAYNYTNRHAGCTGQPTYSQPQAVKQIGGNYYCYDGNGNMTKRVEGGVTYTQNFNVENELSSVVTGGNTTTFTYDAAGIRVKTVRPGGKTSYYPFPTYEEEVNGSVTTQRSAYLLAGQTVGVRVKVVGGANNYYFALTDHLGSTSVLLNNNGGVVSDSTARYLPFGGWRTTPTAGLTDIGFTGHRHNNIGAGTENIGLIYMQVRWYLPLIGRFIYYCNATLSPGRQRLNAP